MPYFPPEQTALQILNKLKTVDGSGSGLDADTVDGLHANELSTVGALNDLTDVTITTPTSNQVLLFNGSIWVNSTLEGGGGGGVTDHGALTGLSGNDHPQYYLASNVSEYGASLIAAINAASVRTLLELGTMATATEANYLLVDGTRASTGRQTFSGGIVTGSIRPGSDSATAVQVRNASGTSVVTVDTTNWRLGINAIPRGSLEVNQTVGSNLGSGPTFIFADTVATNGIPVIYSYKTGSASGALALFGWNYYISSETNTYDRINTARNGWGFQIDSRNAVVDADFEFRVITSAGSSQTRMALQADGDFYVGGTTVPASAVLTVLASGYVGVNQVFPTALLDLAASNTTRASLCIRTGIAPTSPNAGDMYQDGTHVYMYLAGAWKQLDN